MKRRLLAVSLVLLVCGGCVGYYQNPYWYNPYPYRPYYYPSYRPPAVYYYYPSFSVDIGYRGYYNYPRHRGYYNYPRHRGYHGPYHPYRYRNGRR